MFRTVDSGGVPRLGRDIAAAVAGLCGDDTEGYNIGSFCPTSQIVEMIM